MKSLKTKEPCQTEEQEVINIIPSYFNSCNSASKTHISQQALVVSTQTRDEDVQNPSSGPEVAESVADKLDRSV